MSKSPELPIPYTRHSYSTADRDAVLAALESPAWTQGPLIEKFEQDLCRAVGAPHAVAVANGTAALHLGVLALEKKYAPTRRHSGKKVLTSAITFVASGNCALYAGLEVDFVDIDPRTLCMSLDQAVKKIEATPDQYVGVIPVALAGYPLGLEKLHSLCKKHGIWILEDACHALGARTKEKVGSCRHSDAAIFSFHPAKHVATGEGGMLVCAEAEVKDTAALLRTHGIRKNFPGRPAFFNDMLDLGFNFRLPDLLCALGLSQLAQLPVSLARRQELATRYRRELSGIAGIECTQAELPSDHLHAYHLFIVRSSRRDELFEFLQKKQIYCQLHYMPVYRHTYYREMKKYQATDYPEAEKYFATAMSLPMYPGLSDEQQEYVIRAIKEFR